MTDVPIATRKLDVVLAATELSHELLAVLRQRIESHFYDDVRVIDEVARAIARIPMQLM
jgi:hypothetical protein